MGSSSNVEIGRKLPNFVDEHSGFEFDENSVKIIPMKAYSTGDGNFKLVIKRGASVYSGVHKPTEGDGVLYAAHAYVTKKGRSVYLGRYATEEEAARAHDIVTLKCSGAKGIMNFPAKDYQEIMRLTKDMTDDELVAYVRRSGSRFARGWSKFRGVKRCAGNEGWKAHKGRRKQGLNLGTYDTEEEAAMAYDIATIKAKGWGAQTNFTLSLYDVEGIHAGTTKPEITEEAAKNLKQATVVSPLGAIMTQVAGSRDSRIHLSEKYPPFGSPYYTPQTGESYLGLFQTAAMELSYSHSTFKDANTADYSGKRGPVASVNMFHHSSSSGFKPYKRPVNNMFRHSSLSPFKPYKRH